MRFLVKISTVIFLMILINGCNPETGSTTKEKEKIHNLTNKNLIVNKSETINSSLNIRKEKNKGVIFKDKDLERLIRYELNKDHGDITIEELKQIKKIGFGKGSVRVKSYIDYRAIELDKSMGDSIDLSEITLLPNLESLYFFNIEIKKPQTIGKLKNLKALSLSETKTTDLSFITNLTNLTELTLSYNNIENISVVSKLKRLKVLVLQGNKIKNIKPLEGLTNLTNLYLDDNRIEDFTPLRKLKKLATLTIENNPIK